MEKYCAPKCIVLSINFASAAMSWCPHCSMLPKIYCSVFLHNIVDNIYQLLDEVVDRGPLGQNVARNTFSRQPSGNHLVCGLFKRN